MDRVARDPLAVGLLGRDLALDLVVGDDAPLLEVDEEELARLQAAEALDLGRRDVQQAGLGAEDDVTVVRLEPAAGAQAVAVERRADDAPVGEGHRRGTVPRLHETRVVRVEADEVLGQVVPVGVGLRDHHHHRVRQGAPGQHEQLEDVVERRRVRPAGAHDRHDLVEVPAEQLGRELGLAGAHPVHVAHQRVDLAVVGDDAERVRQLPARERVRREAGVHEAHRAREARILQVEEEAADLVGDEHPLVDDRARGERGDVELRARRELADAADHVELALERVLVGDALVLGAHEELPHARARPVRRRTDLLLVERQIAPAQDLLALDADVQLEQRLDLRAHRRVRRQKAHRDAVGAGRRKVEVDLLAQERVGHLREDPGAVAGLGVGARRATVLEVLQRHERLVDDLARRLVVEACDERNATRVVLVPGVVQAVGLVWRLVERRHSSAPGRLWALGGEGKG